MNIMRVRATILQRRDHFTRGIVVTTNPVAEWLALNFLAAVNGVKGNWPSCPRVSNR